MPRAAPTDADSRCTQELGARRWRYRWSYQFLSSVSVSVRGTSCSALRTTVGSHEASQRQPLPHPRSASIADDSALQHGIMSLLRLWRLPRAAFRPRPGHLPEPSRRPRQSPLTVLCWPGPGDTSADTSRPRRGCERREDDSRRPRPLLSDAGYRGDEHVSPEVIEAGYGLPQSRFAYHAPSHPAP